MCFSINIIIVYFFSQTIVTLFVEYDYWLHSLYWAMYEVWCMMCVVSDKCMMNNVWCIVRCMMYQTMYNDLYNKNNIMKPRLYYDKTIIHVYFTSIIHKFYPPNCHSGYRYHSITHRIAFGANRQLSTTLLNRTPWSVGQIPPKRSSQERSTMQNLPELSNDTDMSGFPEYANPWRSQNHFCITSHSSDIRVIRLLRNSPIQNECGWLVMHSTRPEDYHRLDLLAFGLLV